MKRDFLKKSLQGLEFQRNIFLAFSVVTSLSLLIVSMFLFVKKERIVIVPPVLEKEFWVDTQSISATYLEQMGLFLSQLLLNKSPQSAASQRSTLLRHTDPLFTIALKQRLVEEEEILTKQNASYVFYPVDMKVNLSEMSLILQGDRLLFVAGKQVSSVREEYTLHFSYAGARLLLKSITNGNSHA